MPEQPRPADLPRRPPTRRWRGPLTYASLTAVLPGLGHAVAGQRRLGVVFALPVLVLLVVVLLLAVTQDRLVLATRLIDPDVLGALFILQALLLAWRLIALAASLRIGPLRRPRALTGFAVAALVVAVAGPQVWLGYVTAVARQTALEIFEPAGTAWRPSPRPTAVPTAEPSGAPTASPTATPTATPSVPRVTILLIGMDSGVGRRTALTDTMMVVSLDPLGRTVSMLSIPRDIVDVPLPDGRTYRPKLNGLVSDVRHHPSRFPGSDGNGQAVLAAAVGELLGLPVDYWAQVNLGSFIRLVDSLGGVDVNVARAFCDPTYDEYGLRGFAIPAGRWHLSGTQALAYARVRKAAGESDFTRAARQQEVVVGLRDRIVRGGFLQDPVEFLRSLGKTVQTNVPPRLVSDYVALVKEVDRGRVYRRVISHPLVGPGRRGDPRGSIQVPDIEAIRALAADLFPPAGEAPSGVKPATAGGSGRGKALSASSSCRPPRPTPKPTPRPTPKPTAKPTAAPTGAPTPQPTAAPTAAPTATPEPTQAPTPTPAPS